MDGRHEVKYFVSISDCALLRTRLKAVAKPDTYAVADGTYAVRSLYFDNYMDKAVTEKLSGQSRREKFRLRVYNKDSSFIRLEKKSKANQLTYKESVTITPIQCMSLLSGDYDWLRTAEVAILNELYSKVRYQILRPKNIVDYTREAYIFPAGNVRVTFDSNIRTSNNISGFLNPNLTTIPSAGAMVMEVKFDNFLPDIIRDILQIGWHAQTEFSKYVSARLI